MSKDQRNHSFPQRMVTDLSAAICRGTKNMESHIFTTIATILAASGTLMVWEAGKISGKNEITKYLAEKPEELGKVVELFDVADNTSMTMSLMGATMLIGAGLSIFRTGRKERLEAERAASEGQSIQR